MWHSLVYYRSYAVYALILGIAISVSQLRVLARKGKNPAGYRKLAAVLVVMLFYCFISIVEEPNATNGLGDDGLYFLNLFRP